MDRVRRVVSNVGFLLQIAGLLLILPIAIGLQNGEVQAVASLVATCFLCFGVGFVFNAFCERKELDERTSLWLMLFTFTVLPLVLMLPYVWNNVFASGNAFDLFTNSYFETVSGFTTTGFSFISQADLLPSSLLFYRSLVEFLGGVGFIYILVAFMYPNYSLDEYAQTFGVDKLSDNLKKVFISVMLVYTLLVAVFTVVFYFVYSSNLVVAGSTAIDVLTGGYQINITAGLGVFQISVLVLMLLGSVNFSFHYNLFRLKWRSLLSAEIKLYLGVIAVATVLVAVLAWVNPFDSLFHVVSMMSSTGLDYISIATTSVPSKIVFILIGVVGGCAFSMAGGIRVQRVQVLVDAARRKAGKEELRSVLASIAGFAVLLVVLSLVFSTIDISLLDSVFEVSSALTTNGISMGITQLTMPLGYKWLLVFAMIVGRIEILVVLRAFTGAGFWNTAKRVLGGLRSRTSRRPRYTL